MTDIYLLRHGESEMNLRQTDLVGGRSNHTPLTELGHAQARLAGKWLVEHSIFPDVFVASPAVRTINTLELALQTIGGASEVVVEERVQEMTHGDADGKLRHEVWSEAELKRLAKDPMNHSHPGGESLHDVQVRMMDWLQDTHNKYPENTLLVAGHGLAIRAMIGYIMGLGHQEILYELDTPNCSLTYISTDGKQHTVHYVGRDIINELA